MFSAWTLAKRLFFGYDATTFYVRLDFHDDRLPGEDVDLGLEFVQPRPAHLVVHGLAAGGRVVTWDDAGEVPGARCVIGRVLELAVPFAGLALVQGDAVEAVSEDRGQVEEAERQDQNCDWQPRRQPLRR